MILQGESVNGNPPQAESKTDGEDLGVSVNGKPPVSKTGTVGSTPTTPGRLSRGSQ